MFWAALASLLRSSRGRIEASVSSQRMIPNGWLEPGVNAAIASSPCHHTHLTPATVDAPPPSPPPPRFTLMPHPSRCQPLVHSASPLAPWLGLPSNNFISFPPLSRRHAPPLTIGCCFITVGERKKKRRRGSAGQVENPTIADSVLDTEQRY